MKEFATTGKKFVSHLPVKDDVMAAAKERDLRIHLQSLQVSFQFCLDILETWVLKSLDEHQLKFLKSLNEYQL